MNDLPSARVRQLLVVALVAAVVLAGCGAGTEQVDVSAETVRDDALAVAADTDSYTVTGTTNLSLGTANAAQQLTVETVTRVDRAAGEFAANSTTRGLGASQQQDTYLKDGTLYLRSQAFVAQYSSEWVKQDLGENASLTFRNVDQMEQLRVALTNASLSVTGREQVDGVDTYVLEADVNASAIESYALGSLRSSGLAASVDVSDASLTVYAATDDGRPLRIVSATNATVSLQGQTVRIDSRSDVRIGYEPVDVTLPAGAETAVNISAVAG
jgi:hypothetical protein